MSACFTVFAWMIAAVAWMMLTAPGGDARLADAEANRIDDFWNGNTADTAPLAAERWRPMGVCPDQARPSWKARLAIKKYRNC